MPRGVIIVGFAWPFIVVAAAGALIGVVGPRVEFLLNGWPLVFAGAPVVMGSLADLWPEHWPVACKALLTIGLSVPIVLVEVWAAALIFPPVFFAFGGWRWV